VCVRGISSSTSIVSVNHGVSSYDTLDMMRMKIFRLTRSYLGTLVLRISVEQPQCQGYARRVLKTGTNCKGTRHVQYAYCT
jgi:hypothetical protein